MTPSAPKKPGSDPLVDLDDDLGDDWESAFQAEDFMFSPEEESSDFFLLDENEGDKGSNIAGPEPLPVAPASAPSAARAQKTAPEPGEAAASTVLEFPGRLQILTGFVLQLLQARSRRQRLLIAGLPLLLLVIVTGILFFRATSDELAFRDQETPRDDTGLAPLPHDGTDLQTGPTGAPQPPPPTESATVQHKWSLSPLLIVADGENKAELIVTIDIVLLTNLPPEQTLPLDKEMFVKDLIYQFYANRPAYDLRRFALARGEMISQLNAWLNKQWQNNPVDTVIFSRYEITQTAPPSIAPQNTFM